MSVLIMQHNNHRVSSRDGPDTPIYVMPCRCIDGKFGRELNLVVWWSTFATAKLKSANISYSHIIIHMVIPYRIAKFKSANIFAINSRKYSRLYSTLITQLRSYILSGKKLHTNYILSR